MPSTTITTTWGPASSRSAGKTPLVDPGSEVYTARTFSSRRYESKVLNSFGHPVPRVAGQLQQTGRQAAAKVLKTEFTDKADTLVLDIRSAYAVKELKTLHRTFVFSREGSGQPDRDRRGGVRLAASLRDGPDHLRQGEVRSRGRDRRGRRGGAVKVGVTVTGATGCRLQSEEIHEDLPGGRIPTRWAVELAEPVTSATIRLTITPAEK